MYGDLDVPTFRKCTAAQRRRCRHREVYTENTRTKNGAAAQHHRFWKKQPRLHNSKSVSADPSTASGYHLKLCLFHLPQRHQPTSTVTSSQYFLFITSSTGSGRRETRSKTADGSSYSDALARPPTTTATSRST